MRAELAAEEGSGNLERTFFDVEYSESIKIEKRCFSVIIQILV